MNTEAKIVYLAGPIANVTPERALGWRSEVAKRLHEAGHIAFDPARAWGCPNCGRYGNLAVVYMQAVDDFAIMKSDLVVVHYEHKVVSIGTDHEVGLAWALDKQIVVWADERTLPIANVALELWLDERFPGWHTGRGDKPVVIVFDLEALVSYCIEALS